MGLYARCSTRGQTLGAQLGELRGYVARVGAEATEFHDQAVSGKRSRRPGLDALMAACHRHEVDCVVVVKLDRLGRNLSPERGVPCGLVGCRS